jgi:hypothetical protein
MQPRYGQPVPLTSWDCAGWGHSDAWRRCGVGSLLKRLNSVEALRAPGQVISEVKAVEISALVKALAAALAERDKDSGRKGRNPYQSVFGELYRRFRVSSYHNVPADKFVEVMVWLHEYRQTIGPWETS